MEELFMHKYKLIVLFLVLSIILSLSLVKIEASEERKLLAPLDNKIYFAAFPDFGGSEDIVTKNRIERFESLSMKELVWAPFSQHWFNGLAYPKAEIDTISEMGIVPYVRFLPRSDLKQFKVETNFTLEKIINGDFDAELIAWAQSANNHNVPIIIDFALEMNGDWFGWSGKLNGGQSENAPKKYRDAYRHIIDIFRAQNVNHVTWFFHPTIKSTPSEEWNSPKYYYPGDDYIDWIGVSIYGAFHPGENYWDTFEEILEQNYKKILEVSSTKPLAILELGVTDHHSLGKKDKWLKDAFEVILSQKYLHFRAVTYWHENWDNDGSLTSLRVDSSLESLSAFRKAIKNDRFTSSINLSEN